MPRHSVFPRICVALGFPEVEALYRCASEEADNGGTFLEFRLDYLDEPDKGIDAIARFVNEYPACQVVATCRRRENHGYFDGSVESQITLLESAARAGARAVDLEIESAGPARKKLDELRDAAELIVSYHDFEGTPALGNVLARMRKVPAAAYKIAVTARKPADIQRLLALGKANWRVRLILLSMGEIGFPTRVIGPMYGSLYTYAAPSSADGTAPGQVCPRDLRHLYRVEKLTRKSKIYGVVADPVKHSLSPAIHNRAFVSRRADAVYLPFLVPAPRLREFFRVAEELKVAGLSVTIPHKQKVLRYLEIIDPLARRIGAVNTVWRKAGKWRGMNTDVAGVIVPLERRMRLAKSAVLVVGNGGAARAAAFALADKGAEVSITGRDPARVQKLAKAANATPLTSEQLRERSFDALVHATPVGMYPNAGECYFGEDKPIPADLVFDMVYNPEETALLRRARNEKRQVIGGLEMFIEQAVQQFELWTGMTAPRSAMENAAREALAGRA